MTSEVCSQSSCRHPHSDMSPSMSGFAEVGHVAAVLSAIIHTINEEWLELATRPSFSEMLGELGEYTRPPRCFSCIVHTALLKLLAVHS